MAQPATLAARISAHGDRLAVVDPGGNWTFAHLARASQRLANVILGDRHDLDDARIGLLCTPGHDFVVALLGIWRAGGLAVPLHPAHPDAEVDYVLVDAEVSAIVASDVHRPRARDVAGEIPVHCIADSPGDASADDPAASPVVDVDPRRPAMMLYTSGTTGRPKGVVHSHLGLAAQVDAMLRAWEWSADDRTVLVLPLHHVHGVVNVVLCALAAGAVCEAPGSFVAEDLWDRLASGEITVFMAVPTIYSRLIASWESAGDGDRARWSRGARRARLMVSGSAALPVATLLRWEEISGQVLLERYGMTELGMVLSNTMTTRVAGHVGEPLPGVDVRLVDEEGGMLGRGSPGALQVRSEQAFLGYWRRPEETRAAFVDGWFQTGDVAVWEPSGWRLLGRSSVDILKTGGEKVSALEIEEVVRTHVDVVDCAVIGLPDPEWGDLVCAAVVLAPDHTTTAQELRTWAKQKLAGAKVPKRVLVVDELPRNAMGKVTKREVAALFEAG